MRSRRPWLEWHYERFTTPPGAVEVARTADAAQAFRLGPHLGVQFHPESTVEIVARWASMDTENLAGLGIEDGRTLLDVAPETERAAREAAFQLFDAFFEAVREDAKAAARPREGVIVVQQGGAVASARTIRRVREVLAVSTPTSRRGARQGRAIGEFERRSSTGSRSARR